jgi:glycosyltransferase involved in cell wall biosynthesis
MNYYHAMLKVSVIIKALNEERHIARAIESSLSAVSPFDAEVILADSASSDQTIAIAMQYPIKIVTLNDPKDRCCGAGPQLGYQHSQGQYVYILDGDMEWEAAFLTYAIEFLDQEPRVAGVGGRVHEMYVENLEFQNRAIRNVQRFQSGDGDRLNMGGLYRCDRRSWLFFRQKICILTKNLISAFDSLIGDGD